jgi:hypothetical protein
MKTNCKEDRKYINKEEHHYHFHIGILRTVFTSLNWSSKYYNNINWPYTTQAPAKE